MVIIGMHISQNATVSADQAGARHRPESAGNINAGLLQNPPEIVWRIVELIEFYTDYVAFASTCRSLHRSLIPRRLEQEPDYCRTPWEWRLEADLHQRLLWEWQRDGERATEKQRPTSYWQRMMPQPCFNLAMADSACSVETIRSMIGVYEKRWPAFLVGFSKLDFECPLRRAILVGRTDVVALLLERGCPVQGKLQHGNSECVSSPLVLTVGLIQKMHADDLQESRLPLILDRILSHPWFRTDGEALKTLDRVFRSADLAGGWQDVMALIVRDLVSRSSPGAQDMTVKKVRCLVSLAISWNTHGPGSSEDERHQRLRELLPKKEQEEERQGEELEEETAEDDYHYDLRLLFQEDREESHMSQEEWQQPYPFIPDFEAIKALGQIVSGDHSSPDVNTPVVAIV